MEKIIKQYAIRETPKGYQLVEISESETFHGRRKYSQSYNLFYKRLDFATKKAHSFFNHLYRSYYNTALEFVGVIKNDQYRGELA